MRKQQRPKPTMVDVLVHNLSKAQLDALTEEEKTGPMERLRQKDAMREFHETCLIAGHTQSVSAPFPIHWVAGGADLSDEEEVLDIPLEEIGTPFKAIQRFYFYEINGAVTITTKRQRVYIFVPPTLSDDFWGDADYKVKCRHGKRRVALSRRCHACA